MKNLLFALLTIATFQPGVFAQNQSAGDTKLTYAAGVVTDQVGNVYVLDRQSGREAIYKYNSDGKRLCEVTEGVSGGGIRSFAIDKRNGTIYFALSSKIMRATPDSSGGSYEITAYYDKPNGSYENIAVDTEGNVYAKKGGTIGEIIKFDPSVDYHVVAMSQNHIQLLGVDSQNCVFYSSVNHSGRNELCKAIPKGNTWRLIHLLTQVEAKVDAMAFSVDNNCVYLADQAGYIHMGRETDLAKLPSHYDDPRGLAVHGDTLYIAHGADGVLKVSATTGESYASRLFPLPRKEPNHFVRTRNGDYYISCGGQIWQYDKEGNEVQELETGTSVSGVALDKDDNLLFNAETSRGCKLYWRRNGKPEISAHVNYYKVHALRVGGNYAYLSTGTEIRFAVLRENSIDVSPYSYKATSGGLEGVAADKNEEVFYVNRNNNCVERATNVILPNDKIISGLVEPRAIALDPERHIYVSNEGQQPHIGKYTTHGKHLLDFGAASMKNIRDFVVVGNDVIVLQKDGVWRYSNTFAR
ncbi:MAG TPA: hypothetical protein VIS99_09495 [Terrimicrobiaceae bacterium]